MRACALPSVSGGVLRDVLESRGMTRLPARLAATATVCAVAGTALGAPAVPATERVYVQQATELRQSPSEVSRALRVLERGESLESHGRRGFWVNVNVPGDGAQPASSGWVPHEALGVSPPESTPPAR